MTIPEGLCSVFFNPSNGQQREKGKKGKRCNGDAINGKSSEPLPEQCPFTVWRKIYK